MGARRDVEDDVAAVVASDGAQSGAHHVDLDRAHGPLAGGVGHRAGDRTGLGLDAAGQGQGGCEKKGGGSAPRLKWKAASDEVWGHLGAPCTLVDRRSGGRREDPRCPASGAARAPEPSRSASSCGSVNLRKLGI